MINYGLFVLLFLACRLAPDNTQEIWIYFEENNKSQTVILQRQTEAPNSWVGFPQKNPRDVLDFSLDFQTESLISEQLQKEPIAINDFLQLAGQEDWGKIREVMPVMQDRSAMSNPIKINRKGKKITLSQTTGLLSQFEKLSIQYKSKRKQY
ncbi:hypothetical protein [Eisenibacter elegans]|jgi:ribosome-associated protein YbcJ (S4-like RNA binding protein)|uniref:hypothetical protein n=1 Tax=Eisenibacter elegans TaxID=997 RepID=UPI00047D4504|nr:hypothetical protein [Eisenibacter elegans]